MTFPPLIASLHALALYVAAGIAAFGWALCTLIGWDAQPWMPFWFCGALLIYNVDRLRRDPADALNLPERSASIERLRPVCAGLAAIAAAVLLVLPLLRRDWTTFALVIAGTVGCLNYSIPMFGVRLKNVPLLKTFFAPTILLCAFIVPPWLREGVPANIFSACIALAWAWGFLEFNMILCDLRDIDGDRRCGISSLPVLLGERRTRQVLAALILITTALALTNASFDPGNATDWLALAVIGAVMLTMIFVESRIRRPERFYEWLVEGTMFLPALVFAFQQLHPLAKLRRIALPSRMAYSSFSDFIATLDSAGELRRISAPVATELEITELADREMKSPGGGKALLFEKPTVNGEVSPFPVAINTMGSWKRMAMAMNAESVDAAAAELGALMHAKPPTTLRATVELLGRVMELRHARPKIVKDGACKEVIHRIEGQGSKVEGWPAAPDVNDPSTFNLHPSTLLNLPILKCWPLDGGRFITLPCVVTRDPDTGERNVGMYRIQIYDERTTGMHWQLQKVAARHGRRYYEKGERMPVAIFLGGDPIYPFAATAPLPDGLDEFLLAGYLRKKSIELVKCETSDLEVPANSDIVIEGYIDPREPLRDEGPFGDHTGYYTLPEPYPVFHVTAITHRKDAVYPATIVGIPPMEDFYIGGASVKLFLPIFKMNFPEIVDIALPAEGVFHNLVFVSIKKTYPMQAYKIMHGLWGMGQMMFTKYIIVVDDDVDVHNTSEVLFRLCANTDPQRDSLFTKGPSDVLDHATSEIAIGSKLGLDATKKLPGEGFKRTWPPLIKMDAAVKAKVEKLFNL